MTLEEKRPIVSIISNLIIFSIYYAIVINRYNGLELDTYNELKFWAAVFLLLTPVLIVGRIVLYILFSIVNTILTGEKEKFITDEFSRLIEDRSTKNFYHVFMLFFFISLGSLLLGMSVFVMFNILLFGTMLGAFILDFSSFYYLRKGL